MQILYVYYSATNALGYTIPISILLALIISLYTLLRSNRLIALSSLGYSKKKLAGPLLSVGLLISIIYIVLNFTQLAYSKERADAILSGTYFSSSKEDIFLKHDNSYIYFEKIFPVTKAATNIKIYTLDENKSFSTIISAKKATYKDNVWLLEDASIIKRTGDFKKPIEKTDVATLETLKGFKPRILDAIFEKELKLSVTDAFSTLQLFKNDSKSANKIQTTIYYQLIFPLFAPMVMILILYYSPILQRYYNLNLIIFLQILFGLCVWGVLFSLVNLGINTIISPELAVVLPMLLLLMVSGVYYFKLERR